MHAESHAGASAANRPRVLYLGGLGRSGSTIVGQLLGEFPGACAVGEVTHLWQRGVAEAQLCGCGEPFPDCPFWQQVGVAAFGGWQNVDTGEVAALRAQVDRMRFVPVLAAPRLSDRTRRSLSRYLSYYERTYRAITEVSGSEVVIDASKNGSLAFCLRWSTALDYRVVHLVRDPRAVAHSWARQVARPDVLAAPDARGDENMWIYSPSAAAMQWNGQNGAMQMLAHAGPPLRRVRYEDFAAAPGAVLEQIAAFAGLPAGATADFLSSGPAGVSARVSVSHTVSGNPGRFSSGPIAIRPDERWRTGMPPRPRQVVTALTLPLLLRYGYGSHDAGRVPVPAGRP